MIYNNILKLIGNTPIVKINKLNLNPNVKIFAKLEGQNPGGKSGNIVTIFPDRGEKYLSTELFH